jgi:UMF1 family MFS transporter
MGHVRLGQLAFWCTVIVAVFPPFFSEYAAAGLPSAVATSRFAGATTIAVTIVAVMAPVLARSRSPAPEEDDARVFMLIVAATLLMPRSSAADWVYARPVRDREHRRGVNAGVLRLAAAAHGGARRTRPASRRPASPSASSAAGAAGDNPRVDSAPSMFGLADTVAAIKLSLAASASVAGVFRADTSGVRERQFRERRSARRIRAVRGGWLPRGRRYTSVGRAGVPHAFAFLLYNDGIPDHHPDVRRSTASEIGIDRQSRQSAAFILVQFRRRCPARSRFRGSRGSRDASGAKTSLFFALAVLPSAISVPFGGFFMTATWPLSSRLAFLVGIVQARQPGAQPLALYARA